MNSDYKVVNLNSLISNNKLNSEEALSFVNETISKYSCPINIEVDSFLKKNSIDFTKQKKSITYFVFDTNSIDFVGYYSLTIKPISINPICLSNNLLKKLQRFGKCNKETGDFVISAFLIAQIGKNYTLSKDNQISGDELLQLAEESLRKVQFDIGCGFIFLECEDKEYLRSFYEKHYYHQYGKRITDSNDTLLQYIKSF